MNSADHTLKGTGGVSEKKGLISGPIAGALDRSRFFHYKKLFMQQ